MDFEIIEIKGNRLVGRHIREENRLVTLNPLGHRPIKDIDDRKEKHGTNSRTTGKTH